MGFITINNVNILGVAVAVPKLKIVNNNPKFSATTGVFERRITNSTTYTSDLCFESATHLLKDLNINKNDIEILVFVSQTPDYKLPVTSTILQHKLGLPQTCMCFDVPLGCSGYVYGLSIISSLINSGKINKGLLLVGDTISKEVNPDDQSTEPLFGDAGTATLLEYNENAKPMMFSLGSNGEEFESIIIPRGEKSKLLLNGIDVFTFGINTVPKVVNEFFNHFNIDKENIDLFVFHQANKMMNDKIYKKSNIPLDKTITSLNLFGNTSSATIPLTIVSNYTNIEKGKKLMFCGFGVGLSWGSAFIELTKDIHCSKLIEI